MFRENLFQKIEEDSNSVKNSLSSSLLDMGQKIHPVGFRIGITKRHQMVWFARFEKRQYAQTVLEDIFLRKTLQKLFPELLKKKYNSSEQVGKIAHIKIERGLIPYEIGIQIHAQNCEAIKTAVDKLEMNPNLFKNVLKHQFILEQASVKEKDLFKIPQKSSVVDNFERNSEVETSSKTKEDFSGFKKTSRKNRSFNLLEKRFKKRKNVLERFRERILENILIIKKGKKITRKFQKADLTSFMQTRKTRSSFKNNQTQKGSQNRFSRNVLATNGRGNQTKQTSTDFENLGTARLRSILNENREQSQKTTKFMNIFLSKMNQNFVMALKNEMFYWNAYLEDFKKHQRKEFGSLRSAPLGYQSKWSLARLKGYEKQPLPILVKVLKVLQSQALRKLELLRKEFFTLGTLSKMKSFVYFQRIRFIKALKNFIKTSKMEAFAKQKSNRGGVGLSERFHLQKRLDNEKLLLSLTEKAVQQKLTNLKDETRKIQLLGHLQSLVQKHRQKNLYLYLATIADAKKYLRQIQKFTKQQANFLFGIQPSILDQMDQDQKRDFVKTQFKKALEKANCQNELQRNLKDVFIRQIQQQKNIAQQNVALLPKISLKFYSVNAETFETNASIVTDSIVDKLEKREAFRKVIKKVSEDLMKTNKVKGVKIQVSGRLNGAEIARSEWVRAGRVPLQTLRANIDYCYKTAQTIYGIIGVKVWI